MSKIVDRTLNFIELFARERRALTLSDISRLLKIPASSCHDVLRALIARGYLYEIGPRAGFYPTARLHELSTTIAQHDPIVQRADIVLRRLRDEIDESVSLAVATGPKVTYLRVFAPTHPLRFMVEVGSAVRSLTSTSAGKAYLASLPAEQFETYLKNVKIVPMTARSIRSKSALREDIEEGRARGWYLNRGESVEDATTLSAMFRWNNATYVVTIAGPAFRVEPRLKRASELLMGVCRELEGELSPPRRRGRSDKRLGAAMKVDA